MKRQPGKLEQAWLSGQLPDLARRSRTLKDLAAAIGLTEDAYVGQRIRLIGKGLRIPSFDDLRSGVAAQDSTAPVVLSAPVVSLSNSADLDNSVEVDVSDLTDPPLPAVPQGFAVRHVSTLVDAQTGEAKLQWIKTSAQNDERQDWLEVIRSISHELPRFDPVPPPSYCDEDLLAVYPVGDPHVGLLAHKDDAGANFDLKIAKRNLVGAFQHLTNLAPPAAEALLIFIGDNNHADSQSNTTTKGTRVDVDGRIVKVTRETIDIGRIAIDLALKKHGRARLIWERGNHDELIAAMTALSFSYIYENDPRVSVDISPEMFHWYRFGANLIGTHHGDKVKPMDLLGVMAVDRQQDWGETRHRRFYLGHYHHQMVKEVPGLICEYLPTLASSDAWHRSMGYRAQRAMYMDVLHREHGHINRHIVGLSQLRAA